jgi:predicted metalloprotease with PDZ domain
MHRLRAVLCFAALTVAAGAASAAAPPKPLELAVDATDAPRGVFHARMVVPAKPGPLTLAYPKWIQGEHAPTGPIMQVAGLQITARGQSLSWQRDPLDSFLVRVEVPAGADAVEVAFDYLSPPQGFGTGYGETPNATWHLAVVDWHNLVFYPRGQKADEIPVRATLRLPAGWQLDTALPIDTSAGKETGTVTFAPASLYTLIDSPVLASDNLRTIEIGPKESLTLAADKRAALDIPEERLTAYRRVPAEAQALFGGGRPYRRYVWLVALADGLASNGLEHHESSDNRGGPGWFQNEPEILRGTPRLPHEYIHAWNGKYRRPAGLAPRDLQEPLRTDLLWIYEGLTRYIGDFVVAGRAGLWTAEQSREYAAWVAATLDQGRPGRSWRSLADTTVSLKDLNGLPPAWTTYRRPLDYYDEPLLIWLEADTLLRQKSGGTKSLDDFCHQFLGVDKDLNGPPTVSPYTLDDVYAALNRIVPYDWRGFFTSRIETVTPRAPLGGLTAAGWKLAYDDKPNVYQEARAVTSRMIDASFSVGLFLVENGVAFDVVVDSPAWKAGLAPGMRVTGVNGKEWSRANFTEALAATATTPMELKVARGDDTKTFSIDYHGGPRFPHLVRDESHPDLLATILAPRAAPK